MTCSLASIRCLKPWKRSIVMPSALGALGLAGPQFGGVRSCACEQRDRAEAWHRIMINRVRRWSSGSSQWHGSCLIAILVAPPEVDEQRLRSLSGPKRTVDIVFVVALPAFIVLLSIGVLRRSRWMFWLI